jgi:hypothetical protein
MKARADRCAPLALLLDEFRVIPFLAPSEIA